MNGLVSDVMTREVVAIQPETSFREIIRIIKDSHVHALPVVDTHGTVLGVVAESDLLVRQEQTEGRVRKPWRRRGRARLAGTTAGEVMTSPAITIDPRQTLGQAARVLHRRHVGRLLVVDGGRLVGIVTGSDLLSIFLRSDDDLLIAVQAAIAEITVTPPHTITATVDDGIVVLHGSAQLLSQVVAVGDRVRRVPGIVRLDDKAVPVYDDIHVGMAGA